MKKPIDNYQKNRYGITNTSRIKTREALRAYKKREEEEILQGRLICEELKIGDKVSYEHEQGFTLQLEIISITNMRICGKSLNTDQIWCFGGKDSFYPAKYGYADKTWPAKLVKIL